MNEQKRDFINVLRGFAIFLMLWGHSIQYLYPKDIDFFENKAFQFIYSFHMPLFMIISGYLFYFSLKRYDFNKLIIRKTQGLLQPIIMGSILYCALVEILPRIVSGNILNTILESNGLGIRNIGSIWFLWSVLACSIVVAVINKISDNTLIQAALIIFGIFFVCIFPNYGKNIYMYPYFIVGFCFAKIPDCRIKQVIVRCKYISLILFPLSLTFYNKSHFIYTSGIHLFSYINNIEYLKTDVFRWYIGLVGSVFTITIIEFLFKKLYPFFKDKPFEVLSKFGAKSLQIYVLQRIIVEYWVPKLYFKLLPGGLKILTENMLLYNLLYTPIIALLLGIICLVITDVLDKTKISRIIFGK